MMVAVTPVPIDAIDLSGGRRKLDPNWIEALADDIEQRGQQTPIDLLSTGDRFRLIAGGHRLAAQKHRGAKTILAIVKPADAYASEAELKLAEIAENFMRRELSVLDRATDVAAWREIYEAAKGAVKRGGDRRSKAAQSKLQLATLIDDESRMAASAVFAGAFTEAAQQALKLSRDGIFRALKIASIIAPVREQIALLPIADNQSELMALASQSVERQGQIAQLIVAGDAANVAHAIAIIEAKPKPAPLAPYEKLSDKFSRMKQKDQERFFALHREAIEHWLARQER